MMLGLCSALAVTNNFRNSLAMSLGVIFVVVASSTIISAMRRIIPSRVRMAVFMMVISTFTIVVDQVLKALAGGLSVEALLQDYPDLEKEDVQAALIYAAALVDEEKVFAIR